MAMNGIDFLGDGIQVEITDDGTANPKNKIEDYVKRGVPDAFFVVNLGDVVRKFVVWEALLPRVKPHYAVKCNDDPAVLQVLNRLGTGFDCASQGEIEKILHMGVSADRIVYANTCKQKSHLSFAEKHNVTLTTFDCDDELVKIKDAFPNAKLLVRILPITPKDGCHWDFGIKFGCHWTRAMTLIRHAGELELNVVGVSFHCGSGCNDAGAYTKTLDIARKIFDQAAKEGTHLRVLDIGGGFYGDSSPKLPFEEVCRILNQTLETNFPESSGVRIIAEPGRYFVESAFTLATSIIGVKSSSIVTDIDGHDDNINEMKPDENMYYLNDGVYGSLRFVRLEIGYLVPELLKPENYIGRPTYRCSIWGPTCAPEDVVIPECLLPSLNVGDWLVFRDAGAYTRTCGTKFNSMYSPDCFYFSERRYWERLFEKDADNVGGLFGR